MVGEQAPGARLVLSSVPQTPEVPRASRLSLAGAVRCPAPRTPDGPAISHPALRARLPDVSKSRTGG